MLHVVKCSVLKYIDLPTGISGAHPRSGTSTVPVKQFHDQITVGI